LFKVREVIFSTLLLLPTLLLQPLSAQQTDSDLENLMMKLEELRKGQTEIQNRLTQIESQLRTQRQAAQPQKNVTVSIEGHPFHGNAQAKLTLVEFSDYQ